MRTKILILTSCVLTLAGVACSGVNRVPALNVEPPNAPSQQPAFAGQTRAPERVSGVGFDVVTVSDGLKWPWGLAFLPDGRMLVTERGGQLRIVSVAGEISAPVAGLPAVDARDQGGLLDVAIDPAFATNQRVYFSFSEPQSDGTNRTAVARGRLVEGVTPRIEDTRTIYGQAPAMQSTGHYGSRLAFAPDGTLFVTQGDRQEEAGRALVQARDNLIGKIVRINADGSIPADNPFVGVPGTRPEIWSFGHRNSQAAAIHPQTGELWEVEHGTHGGDELNVAKKGHNYGWPVIAYGVEYAGGPIREGITAREGLEQPVYYWDPVIAPSGMLFYTGDLFPAWKGSLFVGGLGSMHLVRLEIAGERVTGEERLLGSMTPSPERIRDVAQGPEGAIYVITDNEKGRILKLVPKPAR